MSLSLQVTVPECQPDAGLQYSVNIRAVNLRDDGLVLQGPWSTLGSVICGENWDKGRIVAIVVVGSIVAMAVMVSVYFAGKKIKDR
jgi:hypothetical protein